METKMKNKIRAWNYFKNDGELYTQKFIKGEYKYTTDLLKKEVIRGEDRCPICTKLLWETDCADGNCPADKGNRYCDKCNCGWLITQMESGD